jgi:hypothetical protein
MKIDNILSQENLDSLDCVGYWPFNAEAYDYSGNSNNITMYNTSYIKTQTGKSAIDFNGTSSYGTPVTDFIKNSGGIYTMMTWFYQDEVPTDQDVFFDSMATSYSGYVRFHTTSDSTVCIKSGNAGDAIDIGIDIEIGRWNHAAVVRDATTTYLYLNGVMGNSVANNSLDLAGHSLCAFGKYPYNSIYYLNGKLANFLAFHSALPNRLIKQFYNATYIE